MQARTSSPHSSPATPPDGTPRGAPASAPDLAPGAAPRVPPEAAVGTGPRPPRRPLQGVRAAVAGDGPPGLGEALDGGLRPAYAALRRDWHARIRPLDEAERAAADAVVGVAWRRWRLEAVEERTLDALGRGRVEPGLPSLATLARYRARLVADRAVAAAELHELRQSRPDGAALRDLSPDRLEWLAARLRAQPAEPGPAEPAPGGPAHGGPEAAPEAAPGAPGPLRTASAHAAPEPARPGPSGGPVARGAAPAGPPPSAPAAAGRGLRAEGRAQSPSNSAVVT